MGDIWGRLVVRCIVKSNLDDAVHGLSLSNRRYTRAMEDIPETMGDIPGLLIPNSYVDSP